VAAADAQDSGHSGGARSVILCCDLRIRRVSSPIPRADRDIIREVFHGGLGVRR
jgi:hypothetical protein